MFILVYIDVTTYAQQAEQSSLYMHNSLYFNPAYAGTRNTLNATVVAREQWVGLKGAPSSKYISLHSPIYNRRLGIGLHASNDVIGSRKKNTLYVDLNTSIKVNKRNDRLNLGISTGIDNYSFGFSELYAIDSNDPIASLDVNKLAPNVGAGIYYYNDRYYAGLSVPSIINYYNKFNDISQNINQPHVFLTGGYVFNINTVMDLKASSMIRYTKGAPLTIDLNTNLLMYKKLWLGLMYRSGEGFGVNASVVIFDDFTIGYAYDYPINELRTYQKGSHEVMLQYDLNRYKNKNKIYSPRYF